MEEVVRRIRIDATANTGNAESSLSRLRDTVHSISGGQRSAASAAKSHTKALSSFGIAAKTAAKHSNFLADTLKRVVVYRALRAAIKEVVKGFKEGLENAYWFSKGINGDLAQALDGLAVKSQTMKNQMGAAFGGLLQTIMPIIQQIISWVTAIASAITALFSMFGGRGTYLKAVDASAKFAKNTKSGAGSAKKMKDYLMGIDELNVIKQPNDGGGGGGSAVPDYSSMFEETELPEWMQGIQDLLNADMFVSAGAALADHFNKIIEDFDAKGFGQRFGEKISEVVQIAWGFLFGKTTTGTGFDFNNLGQKIQEFISSALEEINPEMLGAVLTVKMQAIQGIVHGFLENISPSATGEWLAGVANGWIDAIPATTIGENIRMVIDKALGIVATWLKNVKASDFGLKIGEILSSFLGLDENDDTLTNAFKELGGSVEDLFGHVSDVINLIREWASDSTNMETLKMSFADLAASIQRGLEDASSIIVRLKDDIPIIMEAVFATLSSVLEIIAGTVDGIGLIVDGIELLGYAAGGVYYGLKGQWDEYKQAVGGSVSEVLSNAQGHWQGVADSARNIWNNTFNKGEGKKYGNEFGSGLAEAMESQSNMSAIMTENEYVRVYGRIKKYADGTTSYTRYVAEQTEKDMSSVKEAYEAAQETSETLDTATSSTAEGIKKAIELAVLQAGVEFTAGIAEMETQLAQVVLDIETGVTTMMTNISTPLVAFYNNVMDAIGAIYREIDNAMVGIVENTGIHAGDFTTYITDAINAILQCYNDASSAIWDDITFYFDEKLRELILRQTGLFKSQMMDAAGVARQEIGAIREELEKLDGYTVNVYINVHTIGGGDFSDRVKTKGSSSSKKLGSLPKLGKTAHGGIIKAANGLSLPNRGQLFIAREAGAELVGDIGSGRTAVMNNNQIVESVSAGVYQSMIDALSQTQTTDDRPIVVQVDGREIARAVRSGEKSNGYTLSSNPTFA